MSEKTETDQKIWTLEEAVYRFCDQTTVKKVEAAKAAPGHPSGKLKKIKSRSYNFALDKRKPSEYRPETNNDLLPGYSKKLESEFYQLMIAGELCARARKGSVTAEFCTIPASAWNYLKVQNWAKSVAFEGRKPDRINYYEVQIYLPQNAPSIDQPEPTGVPGGGKISAAEFVHAKLTEFATDRGFDGDELTRHFDQRGHKSEWIKGFRQSGSIVFEASTIRKQLDPLLKDKKFLTTIRN